MEPPPGPQNPFADILPAAPNGPIYDFTNFLTAPAVRETAAREGKIQVVNIPDAVIPSPLAEGITPGTLLQVKEYLTGKADRPPKIGDGYAGNGYEVWASWKRAWDLWNNHYIEGRVNRAWVAEEFPKKKRAMDDDDDYNSEQRAREAARTARRNNPTNPPPRPPHAHQGRFPIPRISPFDPPQPTVPSPDQDTVTTQDANRQEGSVIGSLPSCGHSHGNPPRPAAPGKKWEVKTMTSTMPADSKISAMKGQAMSSESSAKHRIKPGAMEGNVWSTPESIGPKAIENHEGEFSEEHESEDDNMDEAEGESEVEEHEVKQWVEVDDPNAKRHMTGSSNTDASNQRSPKRVKFADAGEPTGNELRRGSVTMPSPQKKNNSPRKQKPQAAERDSSPVRISPRKHVHSQAHNGAPTNPAMIPRISSSPGITMGGTGSPRSQRGSRSTFVFDPNEIINPPDPSDLSTNPFAPMDMDNPSHEPPSTAHAGQTNGPDDERSGGWAPIKNLPQYRMPTDPGLPPDNPAQIAYDNSVFEDVVENSVWRPRRVGEKVLKIDIDGDGDGDPHKLLGISDRHFDSGIDCGKQPYPVLRPLTEYVARPDGIIKKMKIWDGVTGTIFNMPTKPLEALPESDDPKLKLIKHAFSDPYRDEKLEDGPVFPLDIRRVQRVIEAPLTPTPLLKAGESTLIRRDFNPLAAPLRYMEDADPYWVTTEQRNLRDNPSRRWPPGPEKHGVNLPTNDKIWKEELTRDDHYDARYFVTNLQGGTLLINGQQVRKGCIAGPLPAFAVIECPGGQVAFWWGTDGKNYKASHKLYPGDLERKWETLRRTKGCFEFAGMSAGMAWDMKIADRVRRERTGNDQDDDEQWKCWKNPKKVHAKPDESAVFQLYEEPRFAETDHADFELKWALARLHRRNNDPDVERPSIIFPEPKNFWPGPVDAPDSDDAPPKSISRDDIEILWLTHGRNTEMRQGTYLQLLKTVEEQEERQQQLNLDSETQASNKRKADGLFNPVRKRIRAEREAAIQKGIDERQRRAANLIRVENEAIAEENARVKMLQDEARIAAAFKAELERNSAATRDTVKRKLEDDEMARRAQEDEKRRQLNTERGLRGQPLLPSRDESEMIYFGRPLRSGSVQQSGLTGAEKFQISSRVEEAKKRAEAAEKRQAAALKQRIKEEEMKRAEATGGESKLEVEKFSKEQFGKQVKGEEAKKLLETADSVKVVFQTAAILGLFGSVVAPTTAVGEDTIPSYTGPPPDPKRGTLASRTGVPFPNTRDQFMTASEMAERLADLQKWKYEIRTTARAHIEDMRHWAGQAGLPSAIQVANQAGFATIDDYRNNRVRQIVKKHYGVEMITADHVPFRREEGYGGRSLFLMTRAKVLRTQFYTMLEDLRDWEARTRWSEDPRSHVVRVDFDGAISAEV